MRTTNTNTLSDHGMAALVPPHSFVVQTMKKRRAAIFDLDSGISFLSHTRTIHTAARNNLATHCIHKVARASRPPPPSTV